MKRAAILLIVTTLLPVGAARAHRKNYIPKGYVSNISAVVPNVLGVSVNVLGGDERLRLSNYSGKTVVILGYQGEPYLRFTASGVFANELSPASYLNRMRKPRRAEAARRRPDGGSSLAAGRASARRTSGTTTGSTGRQEPAARGVRLHPDRIQRDLHAGASRAGPTAGRSRSPGSSATAPPPASRSRARATGSRLPGSARPGRSPRACSWSASGPAAGSGGPPSLS